MTVASRLRSVLVVERGKTVTDVARELDMSRPAFSNVINGNVQLSIALALKIETMFGLEARKLLIAQLDENLDTKCRTKP